MTETDDSILDEFEEPPREYTRPARHLIRNGQRRMVAMREGLAKLPKWKTSLHVMKGIARKKRP